MRCTSIIQKYKEVQLAIRLISLGARIQMLESETNLSRGKLIKLYKEIQGCPPPKGLLPFSTTWFMTWEPNIHSSIFYNAYHFLVKHGTKPGIQSILKAYQLYLEQCPSYNEEPVLGLTRAWILVKFVESNVMQQSCCKACKGRFITHAYQPHNSFICSLCQPPSRAEKNNKTQKENHAKCLQVLSIPNGFNSIIAKQMTA
ncbi:flagellar transcriptional regulator FlhC [Gilliamella sp. B3791]|uniref:flagellar transcriptional regulator FlhC n=1 Tax=unclassified Gilliamella TaxID=2685620 RepID=UPI002269DB44|nr:MULTISPECIES: flagellar transcriptional regulator FlhC [unclassified Gilliamella]MCX8642633.1 flagellar transcriptional regulator FlhC [Gilliamella sp. B3835]MCX8708137.1 flagellar transcriptional regulator FlhC [Gilliamella sp. B3783]MCX8709543.1 flagellar transcriptional regulator FlhC [Gilliamella sp. B3780]MCX8712974.1 flagellar transcriptional regulator FlhC [Gilliamella sp. B3468]MCX8717332.1 flagellar transcriptional regulator FlhC [Gilliamella sp. B3784]